MKIEECYGKYTFVDVRSPKEFEEDCIPGAINIPLFSNEERTIVGTLYKQVGKEAIALFVELGHQHHQLLEEFHRASVRFAELPSCQAS